MKKLTMKDFLDSVEYGNNPSECWLWLGPTNGRYGTFGRCYAHRFSYQSFNGPIPPAHVVMHACDEPLCVNPRHLSIGSPLDNQRDCVEKGRKPCGEDHHLTTLTADQVREIRNRLPRRRTPTGRLPAGTVKTLANEYGVCKQTITNISRGKTWARA